LHPLYKDFKEKFGEIKLTRAIVRKNILKIGAGFKPGPFLFDNIFGACYN